MTWISERINQRAYLGIFVQLWFLPCVLAMSVVPNDISKWARFAIVTVLLSYPTPHPMQVGWCSRNSNTVRTRTVSAALYNMAVQIQAIIYSNIYRADDRPLCECPWESFHINSTNHLLDRRGNRVLVGICVLNIFSYLFAKFYYVWRNKQRAQVWDALTAEEKLHYMETTTDEGSKRLDFRFAH